MITCIYIWGNDLLLQLLCLDVCCPYAAIAWLLGCMVWFGLRILCHLDRLKTESLFYKGFGEKKLIIVIPGFGFLTDP